MLRGMRILIVGAGIAGMTLAALLERRGESATLIERAPDFEHAGYMLGLYGLGSRVLHGLGLYEKLAETSVALTSYEAYGAHGELIKRWPMDALTQQLGPLYSATRPQIVALLQSGLRSVPIHFGVTLKELRQGEREVVAVFSDGGSGAYDLVVGADGMRSQVRGLLFGEQPHFETGWGGWVFWARSSLPPGTFAERWGRGSFVGAYPTQRGAGVFAGSPLDGRFESQGAGRRDRLREHFAGLGGPFDALFDDLPADDVELFFWRLADVRAERWSSGRVVLLGDAAAGFLPTAGVGASMAMESAAVLDDELGRTDAAGVEHAIRLYEKRRRRRVEAIQDESRTLAKLMFIESAALTSLRNFATRFVTVESFIGSIVRAFDEPL